MLEERINKRHDTICCRRAIVNVCPKFIRADIDLKSKSMSRVKVVLSRLTLDWEAAILALKTSLAPAVLVCLIESTTWINHFTTNSYLASIVATCALPTLPRAKLIDYNFQLALALAVVYCYSLLAGWCGLQARRHTTSSTEELKDYNSSAEAVAAIFLIFIEWLVFTLKSAFPVWQLQCVLAGIYCVAVLPPTARAPDTALAASASRTRRC
jgi:hypothetical protein